MPGIVLDLCERDSTPVFWEVSKPCHGPLSGRCNVKGIRMQAVISVSLPDHEKQVFSAFYPKMFATIEFQLNFKVNS